MDIFVYGTLRCRALFEAVAGPGAVNAIDASIDGYVVRPVANHVVPLIRAQSSAIAKGLIWKDLTKEQVVRLDAYESAFGYALIDVLVHVERNAHKVKMYLPPDDIAEADHEWSLSDWENGHLRPAVLTAKDLFAGANLPSAKQIRRDWPMVERRAWAKFRAENENRPAARRIDGTGHQTIVQENEPHVGAFYRMQNVALTHDSFRGKRLGPLHREAFIGIDAAVVLPYDPKSDRVLLIEQLRMGPLMRHDPNPWSLEPIAGMIDARETPEQAAMREAKEEAEIEIKQLVPISANYPSPGSATDFFYCFLGICELPENRSYVAGLEAEQEDLRVHIISYDEAMSLVASGEIATGPLVMMMYWLALERERLRATA